MLSKLLLQNNLSYKGNSFRFVLVQEELFHLLILIFIFRFEGEHHLPHVEHHVGHFVPVGGHHEEEVEVVHHHGPTIEEDIHYIDNNDLNFIRPVR